MRRLRVVSLNIWNKQGPWDRRRVVIANQLRALDADLIGLQEVLRLQASGSATTQTDEFASPGYHLAFGVAHALGGGLEFGNALLSRWPIVETQTFALPAPAQEEETRCLLYALVASPFGKVPVFVTHLNWKLHEGSTRIAQVKAIAEHVSALAPIDTVEFPPVLVGDFNSEPDSDEMRYLRGLATVDGRSVFFADAWLWAGDGSAGTTYDKRNPYADSVGLRPRRIDYVYVRGPDKQRRGLPLEARVVCDAPEVVDGETVWPTDHFGVLADLSVDPRPPKA